MNEFIKGETIYLRPVLESDAERCVDWLNNQELTRFMEHGVFPQKLSDELNYIRNAKCMLAICTLDDTHIGNIELKLSNSNTASISIIVGERRGNGYGTEAVRLLVDHAFNRIPLDRITAGMVELNKSSSAIFEKNGFEKIGYGACFYTGGEYLLTVKYELTRKEWEDEM